MKPLDYSRPETLHDHIKELRKRLIQTSLLALVGATAGYVLRKPLITFLQKPLHQTLYYTSPSGGFTFVMKISFVAGLLVGLPLLIYNLISFIRPAFSHQIPKSQVRLLSGLSLLLALTGGTFGFFVVVPMSLRFFQGFQMGTIQPLINATDYVNFVINCIVTFMLIFQIPLIILFIDRIKPLKPSKLLKYEKFVIVGSLLLALVLPFTYDPLTQFLLAVPIVGLYNLSIVLIMFAHISRRRTPKRAAPAYVPVAPVSISLAPKPPVIETPPARPALAKIDIVNDIVTLPRHVNRRPIYIERRFQTTPLRTNFLDLRQPEVSPDGI